VPDEVLALRSHHVRDAHRRWQRHTYQEGPGFRFLATRGGRPPLERTPRRDLAIVRERARLVRTLREEGLGAALALGRSSRASLFRWQAAFERGGLAALVPQRCGPHVPLVKHPAWLEQVVIAVRLATYWNAKRISAELRRREIATVGQWWIERLFDDLGTARPSGPRERGPRYERGSPNRSGTSISRVRSGSSWGAAGTSRPSSSGWSTTTPASSSACGSCPRRALSRSSPGWRSASSSAAGRLTS